MVRKTCVVVSKLILRGLNGGDEELDTSNVEEREEDVPEED